MEIFLPKLTRRFWVISSYVPFVIVAAMIFVFSSMSHPPIPKIFHFYGADKILHLIAYFCLGTTAAFATSVRRMRHGWFTFVEAWFLASCYGIVDELHQIFVPYRSPSIYDWFADTVGVAAGAALTLIVLKTAKVAYGFMVNK